MYFLRRMKSRAYTQKNYNEFIGEKWVTYFRAQNRGTFVAGETTKGLSQLKAMKNKLMIPKTMYFEEWRKDV